MHLIFFLTIILIVAKSLHYIDFFNSVTEISCERLRFMLASLFHIVFIFLDYDILQGFLARNFLIPLILEIFSKLVVKKVICTYEISSC